MQGPSLVTDQERPSCVLQTSPFCFVLLQTSPLISIDVFSLSTPVSSVHEQEEDRRTASMQQLAEQQKRAQKAADDSVALARLRKAVGGSSSSLTDGATAAVLERRYTDKQELAVVAVIEVMYSI